MADSSVHRAVTVERIAQGVFTAANTRGGQLRSGTGSDTGFTPTELLLAAIAGCTAIDIDILTSRRAEPGSFRMRSRKRMTGCARSGAPSRPAHPSPPGSNSQAMRISVIAGGPPPWGHAE